jgi:hypothetical protein
VHDGVLLQGSERHEHDVDMNIAERLERALARVDGPEQSENNGYAAALGPARPSDRRRRSPQCVSLMAGIKKLLGDKAYDSDTAPLSQ